MKGKFTMKKFISLLLAALMMLTLVSCGNANDTEDTDTNADTSVDTAADTTVDTDATTDTEAAAPVAENALEILNTVWGSYAEDEKFPVGGGFGDTMSFEGPENIPTDNEEAIATAQAYFVLTEDAAAMVDDIAHLMHMLNANTFTAGVFHIKADADVDAFVASVKESVTNNQWFCGAPEKLVVLTIGDYVVTVFGHAGVDPEFSANTVPVFVEKVQAAYPSAVIAVEEPLL